ncbi:hypothetical protein ACFLQU_03785 [Verrucomicrobiota bacterium]
MTEIDPEHLYGDDETHPIPFLDRCDINAVKETGGADLTIVIDSPLPDDQRSGERLVKKIENYLGFINAPEFIAESGDPTPDNTNIVVALHADSAPITFTLLDKCKPWVLDNNATLVVKHL